MAASAPTGTLGFLAPTIAGTYYRNVLAGVYRVARARGMRLVVAQALPRDIVAASLALRQVDGWVSVFNTEGAEALAAHAPVVTVSRHVPGLPAVLSDNIGGERAVVRHLTQLGHRRIAFVGSTFNADVPERLAGYRAALEEAGLPFDDRLVFSSTDDGVGGGLVAGRALLASGASFTAVAAATDHNALGIMQVLREAGRRCPEDVAIVGFDDMPESQVSSPPLTTVRLRFEEFGRVAALRLLMHLADPSLPPSSLHVATALVVRRSCGAAEQLDPHQHAHAGLSFPEPAHDWRRDLALRLAALIQYPLPLPADAEPEEVWPGVTALVDTLAAALDGGDSPTDAAIQRAWDEATAVAGYADACGDALTALEAAGAARLATLPPYRQAPERVGAALVRMRSQLLRVTLSANAHQLLSVEGAFESTDAISRELADSTAAVCRQLGWLRHSGAAWGALGLWEGGLGSQLAMAGVFVRGKGPIPATARSSGAGDFPPADLAPAHGADVTLLVPVRTPRREWGVLALGTTLVDRMNFVDSSRTWAGLLGARLDDGALLEELERQQAGLRESFERERALADTVREIGSPVIPLGGGALLVPLIGVLDSGRAQQVIEAVLGAVSSQNALDVLLDISGVPLIDTHVAGVLVQLAQMLRLLGARATMIGVRPEIAQSIVSLGVDLRELTSHTSIESALRAMRR